MLDCFDGEHTELDLRSELVRLTGEIQVGDIERNLFDSLNDAGFLETEKYRKMRADREAEFAAEAVRPPLFAGSAYPSEPNELSSVMSQHIGVAQGTPETIAIAAPHASPAGGWDTYRAAYQALPARDHAEERIFVVLGTSHYGAPDRFGLTRKPYVTPYGASRTDTALVDELVAAAPKAIRLEDYCHAVEHSIEFQILFLQHVYGPSIRVLPILCGPFVKSVFEGGLPEDDEDVSRFFDAAANIAAREGKRLFWVLGVDMAHMGSRYGDPIVAQAHAGNMLEVEDRDSRRIQQLTQGNRGAYWNLIQERHDDLKWCGSAPFYTFLKVMPDVKGELLHYDQWQIDPQSVVSFGAMRFE